MDGWHTQIVKDFAAGHQVCDPALEREVLARDGGIEAQVTCKLAAQRVLSDRGNQLLAIGQFSHFAAGMRDDHLFEIPIGFRVADQAGKGRKARTG